MNIREVKLILNQLNLNPNKQLGQNFLIDKNIVNKIISISEIFKNDVILEIGSGLGALTKDLAKLAKKVYAVEIDYRLCTYLEEKFSIIDNIEIIQGDVLEIEIPSYNKVISNIPYKITGPILEKVFYKEKPPLGVLTIETSIANRIFFTGNYKNFSRITVGVNAFMNPILKSSISRKSFYPNPKIALSLIKLIPRDYIDPFIMNTNSMDFFLKFIAGIMPYKNKNIVNAIDLFFKTNKIKKYSKERILTILNKSNYENKKLFSFKINDFIEISKLFYS
ncbi:MAG: 16S rRNA (adenine(1518)-N(6)/adenine(1519)-N(6))-dimethyltransferase RsmA [Candidatus Hodarchaeota archaeon]